MNDDEQTIRELVANWQDAAGAGDLPTLLGLMAEDVVFLVAGQPPMRGREAFAQGFQAVIQHHRIKSKAEVQEVHVQEIGPTA